MSTTPWSVDITGTGRSGDVVYRDPQGELRFYWEIGGGETVASVLVGTADEWAQRHPWAAPRRQEIVDRVLGEVLRRQAPGCSSVVGERGWVNLVRSGEPPPARPAGYAGAPPPPSARPNADARAAAASWYFAMSARRARIVGIFGIVVVAAAIVFWLGRSVMQVRTTGSPSGSPMRVGRTVVVLMTRLEPYVPSLVRDPGKDRYRVGLLLLDAENGDRKYVELARGRTGSQLGVIRLLAVQGSRIWVQVPETMMYDVDSRDVASAEAVERDASLAPPALQRSIGDYATGDRVYLRHLAAGGQLSGMRWLGLYAPSEIGTSIKEGFRAPLVADFERSSSGRRLYAATLRVDGATSRFASITAVSDDSLFNAAFVRDSGDARMLELAGGGWLMVHETKPRGAGTIVVSRVDAEGKVAWRLDTGLGSLLDILPHAERPVLVGRPPQIPDKVPEPTLLVVDARKGRVERHSLWMMD